jgi:general secretion pathway protein D
MKTILILILLISSAQAALLGRNSDGDFVLNKKTFMVSELASDYAKLMDYNLSVDQQFTDESFTVQGATLIKKDRIENYVSLLLSQSGNAVIHRPDSRFMQVISARDIRYTTLPVFRTLEEIPQNDNHVQFSYGLKHMDSSELSRNMRPFLSRYGRIIDIKSSNSIHITDTGNNVIRMVQILLKLDTPEYAKSKKEMEEINEKHKKTFKKSKSFFEILTENEVIFILVFFLMGSIIGFGSRGYMMKKVEGGW